jgi:HEAT repeat protein
MKRPLLHILSVAAAVFAATAALADPWKDVLGYKLGQPRTALSTIEDQIRASKPGQLRATEDRLLAVLKSSEATVDCRDWACRQLRQAGSERSVPALAARLADKELSTVARFALQGIPGPAVDAALRDAVPRLSGDLKAGAIQTLGARRDRQAVPLVGPLAGDANTVVAEMALYALGNIGGPEALAAIRKAKVPPRLTGYRFHAMLLAAEQLEAAEAAGVYAAVLAESADAVVKVAALRGLVRSDRAKAGSAIEAALQSTSKRLRLAAVRLACERGRPELLTQVLPRVASLPADAQVTFLTLVDDSAALPSVLALARCDVEPVAQAAVVAMGRIGDARVVSPLLELACAKGPVQAAARSGLEKLRAKQAGAMLVTAAEQAGSPARPEAIRALGARGATQAVSTLLKIAAADRTVRVPALVALGALADAKTLPALLKLLTTATEAADRDAAQAAVVATCRRLDNSATAADAVSAAIPGSSVETRAALLAIVAGMPSAKSLAALRAAVKDPDATVRTAAIRGLAGWPDPVALDDLLAIARGADRPAPKVLALRGIVRLATISGQRPSAQSAKILVESLALCARPEEKRLVLGALGEMADEASLAAALGCLADRQVEVEAATAAVRIAKTLRVAKPQAAREAVERVLEKCQSPAARKLATAALLVLDLSENIAPQGTATSPDDLDKDGASGGDQAAIDNNPATYWDEVDGRPLYRLVVTFKGPERVAAISIMGYAQHSYAPKTFDILCDGKVVQRVENARYDDNLLVVRFPPVTCTSLELKITGYYGRSPGVRELGIYRSAGVK